jgi:DNA-binding CsgD family transcriptional regulator
MPVANGPQSLMSALGFAPEVGVLYGRLLTLGERPAGEVAALLRMSEAELDEALVPLDEIGVVARHDGVLRVLSPVDAVTQLLTVAAASADRAHHRMLNIARALPYVAGSTARPPAEHVDSERLLDGELFTSDRMREALEAIAVSTVGQVRWLRPDRFEMGYDDVLAAVVGSGRRVRTLYPIRALSESATTLSYRARLGEEIRLVPEVPTRLMVLGTSHAIMPEPLGLATTPRAVVRQPALVQLCALYFDLLWDRSHPMEALARGEHGSRRVLLEQLSSGASDEQIARRLGVSVRTVRRRVAELLEELGAESRFAAGVAAARRGWL